ncbi:uncharacterized protein [Onthophagus taurus]|uniref:uncharacterized protein isoform X1 n=1 Tax=Onthophagus taurus TaxID=166361 RepID=UPI0039BE5B93
MLSILLITRKNELTITFLFLTTLRLTNCYNAKSYDNNDWIPIHQPDHKIQKKAVERVLTIPEQAPLRFFPEEYRNTRQAEYQQQYLREISNQAQQRPHHHHNTKQQFTPQQLEQYYIDQRKKLNEQRNLQQALHSQHQQENSQSKPYQNQLLKQTYESLPREYLHPPSPQQLQPLSHHYLFPNQGGVQLVQENKGNHPVSLTQLIQQPPGANGTVGFYNNLNENFNNVPQNRPIELTTSKPPPVKEDVQLLYLPIEQIQPKPKEFTPNLQNQHVLQQQILQPQIQQKQIFQKQILQPQQFQSQIQQQPILQNRPANLNYLSSNNNQEALLRNIQNDFIQQALQAHKLQEQLDQEVVTPETVVKKRKPHQPPLAVYMNGQEHAHVTDVVKALKDSKMINVQDTIGPDSPHVFVGPANLNPPNGFSKFELPYLSSIENNRVERKVDQYPFFVAPLNYKTLPGYEKIPFPPPHVGSVVLNVNGLEKGHHKTTLSGEKDLSLTRINFNEDKDEEVVHVTKRPTRQRGRQRITTPPPIETTSYEPPVYNNAQVTSSSSGNIQKPVSPQTQFNQNIKYYPGINLEDLREYQVEKTNYQPTIQEIPKFKYIETNPDNSPTYNIHDSPPEKRKPKPSLEIPTIPEHKPRNNFANPYYNPDSTSSYENTPYNYFADPSYTPSSTPPTTTKPKLEEYVRLVKVSEEMVIRPQSNDPPPKDFVLLQDQKEEIHPESPLINKHSKQYLPINQGSLQNIPQVNYDHLFETPFVTKSEVNQINSAAKSTTETPQKLKDSHVKYVVLEEYPVKENVSRPLTSNEDEKDDRIFLLRSQGSDLNDLADPSIRQLLTPSLLAPTEKPHEEVIPKQEYVLTTPEPVVYKEEITTTTPRADISRVRTRGRGGSRFNIDRTSTYAPRTRISSRTRTRQRPISTTTTTEQDRDIYISTPTPRIASTRQRFRSRGRPMISQGYSSTISNVQYTTEPTTEAVEVDEIKKDEPKIEASFTEESVSKPQLILKAKTLSPEEEYLITKYNLPSFSTPAESKSEKYNIELATEKIGDLTTIYSPSPEYVRSIPTSTKPRIRQRIRGKSRTTKATTTTSEAPEEASSSNEQEFYGFFRQPNFKSTTEEPIVSSTPKLLLQLEESSSERSYNDDEGDERIQIISNGKEETPKPIQFIGEILPKYTTTEKYYEITPELVPIHDAYIMTTISPPTTKRGRTRGRYTTRRTIEHKQEEFDSVPISSIRTDDRASHPSRSRSRGRTHFKVPVVLTSEGEDNNNYPALYLKAQHDQENYTPQTSPQSDSFKITVDPLDDDDQNQDQPEDQPQDQEPHASALSSKYAAPSNNFFHTTSNPKELKYIGGKNVHFNGTNFRANLTTIKLIDVELETTESSKRKGFWKLIKKKIPEEFEEAESQNVGFSRENEFEVVDAKHRILSGVDDSDVSITKRDEDNDFIGGQSQLESTQKTIDEDVVTDTINEEEVTMSPNLMKDLKTSTSTSTEISRDAEICSKGICVKQEDYDSDK